VIALNEVQRSANSASSHREKKNSICHRFEDHCIHNLTVRRRSNRRRKVSFTWLSIPCSYSFFTNTSSVSNALKFHPNFLHRFISTKMCSSAALFNRCARYTLGCTRICVECTTKEGFTRVHHTLVTLKSVSKNERLTNQWLSWFNQDDYLWFISNRQWAFIKGIM